MSAAQSSPGRFLRLREVEESVGLGRSTIYRHMDKALFPRPVEIGPNCVRWRENEVEAWKAARVLRSARERRN